MTTTVRGIADRYAVCPSGFALRGLRDGSPYKLVSNFTAKIIRQYREDPPPNAPAGLMPPYVFVVEITNDKGRKETLEVPSGRFAGLSWLSRLGLEFRVYPGGKTHIPVMIQCHCGKNKLPEIQG